MNEKIYDVVIIGAGPAGLSAGLYAGRGKLDVLIIEKPTVGSLQMAHKVDNYPGFSAKTTGKDLYKIMKEQVAEQGVEFVDATFLGFNLFEEDKIVKTDKDNYKTKSIIIASGWAKNKEKKIKGEEEYLGKGVSYCATCDGAFTRNMTVSLVGKGEEIAEEALFLLKFSKKINIFVTAEILECDEKIYETLKSDEKVEIFYSADLLEIKGEDYVESLIIRQGEDVKEFESQFAFLYLGTKSLKELYGEVAELNEAGYVITDETMKTKIEGIYAAGDVRAKNVRQITTAVSDGTIAGMEVIKHILKGKTK